MPPNKRDDKDLDRGERLQKIRNFKQMTQAEFADFLGGQSRGSMHNWESKGHPIPNSALAALIRHGFSLRYLFDGEGPMQESAPDGEPGAGSEEAREIAVKLLQVQASLSRVAVGLLEGRVSAHTARKTLRNLTEFSTQIQDLEPRPGRRTRSS